MNKKFKIMKKIICVFCVFLFSCDNSADIKTTEPNVVFYKFFDAFAFKGINQIDSNSIDFPFYKVYFDSLKNITSIDEYISPKEKKTSKVRYRKNFKVMIDSSSGAFANEVVTLYRFFAEDKVVSLYNFRYTNTSRKYTSSLNIYTPQKQTEYTFKGDGNLANDKIDSSYLKKIIYIDPESIVSNNFNFNESLAETKVYRDISILKNKIIVNTTFVNSDTSIKRTFTYDRSKYDEFWVAKYNFYDSIPAKLYYEKYLKSL